MGAEYSVPVNDAMSARAGFDVNYVGKVRTAISTTGQFTLPSYTSVDLRGGLEWKSYSLDLVVENVTDKRALVSATTTSSYPGSPAVGTFIRPRRVLLALNVKY